MSLLRRNKFYGTGLKSPNGPFIITLIVLIERNFKVFNVTTTTTTTLDCQEQQPEEEVCGPTPNRDCVFPFKHNRRTYNKCTTGTSNNTIKPILSQILLQCRQWQLCQFSNVQKLVVRTFIYMQFLIQGPPEALGHESNIFLPIVMELVLYQRRYARVSRMGASGPRYQEFLNLLHNLHQA